MPDGFDVVATKSFSLSSDEDEEEVASEDISEPLSAKISSRMSADPAISLLVVCVRTRRSHP